MQPKMFMAALCTQTNIDNMLLPCGPFVHNVEVERSLSDNAAAAELEACLFVAVCVST